MRIKKINLQFSNVLDIADGNACKMRLALSTLEILPIYNQYYSLRNFYCLSKFNEKYGRKDFKDLGGIPRSILDHWETCDAAIQKAIDATGLSFYQVAIPIDTSDFDAPVMLDATGSMDGRDLVLIKLVTGKSWRKRHKIQLVKQMEYCRQYKDTEILGNRPDEEIALLGLVLGNGDAVDARKIVREIPMEGKTTKKGKIKRGYEPWSHFSREYDRALVEARDITREMTGMNVDHVETHPNPLNCGSCPYHNLVIDVDGNDKTCTGYLHDAR